MSKAIYPARQLRSLMIKPGIIRSLAAHDVLTALLIEQAGFESVFIGGFGTSASLYGLPDLNFLGLAEMAEAVRRMTHRVSIPVIADGDTGHGDLHNVMRCVAEFEGAGAAGVILEDQIFPKRCGHFEGKQVIPARRWCLNSKPPCVPEAIRILSLSPAPMPANPMGSMRLSTGSTAIARLGPMSPLSRHRSLSRNWRRSAAGSTIPSL